MSQQILLPKGGRIDLHHLAERKSEPARKEVEKIFGLVPAEGQQTRERHTLQPISVSRVNYGRTESKKAMTTVFDHVLNHYKYTSLPELNAVLRQYNMLADRGSENSRVFKANGLLYRILDDAGNTVGVPIKASDFYNKPTQKFLEAKYTSNEVKRMPHKAKLRSTIDMALFGGKATLKGFVKELESKGVHVALRQNENGLIYGITYVDHTTKCVFNGSALGKAYSAKGVLERCAVPHLHAAQQMMGLQPSSHAPVAETRETVMSPAGSNVLDALLQPEQVSDYVPYPLKKDKKQKKRGKRPGQ